jgi:hypothetical protein
LAHSYERRQFRREALAALAIRVSFLDWLDLRAVAVRPLDQ